MSEVTYTAMYIMRYVPSQLVLALRAGLNRNVKKEALHSRKPDECICL
jgi:hypothetical protein